jgi:OFA family oxalate/formate antiporter-like MFS transporter
VTCLRPGALRTLFACVVGLTLSVVPIFCSGTAVLLVPIAKDTSWTRGQVSALIAAGLLGIAVGAPIVGRLIQRYGVRRVILVSSVAFPATLLCLSYAQMFGVAVVCGFAAGLVGCGVSQYSYLAILPKYFDRRLGLSLGVAMIGIGLGTALVPLVVQSLAHIYSWRGIYRTLAVFIVLVGVPNALLLPHIRVTRRSAPEKLDAVNVSNGMTAAEALRTRIFYQLALCIFLSITVITGLGIHLTAFLTDRGYSPERAAGLFSFFGLTLAGGRFAGGLLLDYLDARWIGATFLFGAALGVSFMATGATGYLLFVAIGLLSAATGFDGDLVPYATRSYFGLRSYSTIYGMLGAAYSLGPPVGSLLLGQGFDRLGSYTPLLWGIVGIVTLSALLLLGLGRPNGSAAQPRVLTHEPNRAWNA